MAGASVPEVVARELAEALATDAPPQLVDVRTALEHRQSRVPGAVSAPLSTLDALELDPTRPVVAICLSAHRSIPAVEALAERGFDAAQLKGGMLAWWAAGLPTEKG